MSTPQLQAPAGSATVLLVDGNPQVADLQQKLLVRAGFRVKLASTGPDGLRLARAEAPNAVVLAGDLPGMDGFEVCRQLKADEDTRHIPVLFCSGHLDARERAREAGADHFLAKPNEVMHLPERLAWLLGT